MLWTIEELALLLDLFGTVHLVNARAMPMTMVAFWYWFACIFFRVDLVRCILGNYSFENSYCLFYKMLLCI